MGIFDNIGGKVRGLFSEPTTAQMIGMQMLSNSGPSVGAPRNLFEGVPNAVMAGNQMQQERVQRQSERAKQEKQLDWLNQSRPDLAEQVAAGLDPSVAIKQATNDLFAGSDQGSFTTPFQAVDENGKTVFLQADKNGNVKSLEGFTPSNPIKTLSTKTEQLVIDGRSGNVISRTPIQNLDAARDTAIGSGVGKSQAEAINATSSLESKMPGLRTVVNELKKISDEATYTVAGQALDEGRKQLGMEPRSQAVARTKYISVVDNQVLPLLRDIFGAAFTKAEGDALRATLGDPNKTPEEKKSVLESFIAQKERDLQALKVQSGTISNGPVSYEEYFKD